MTNSYKNYLITGGCGFIGSHFVRYMLNKYPNVNVINVDLLTYCGNPENVKDAANDPRYKFYKADIGDYGAMLNILKKHQIDCVVNFAAESDNNKAVHSPVDFAKTNALGTAIILEASRQHGVKRFHHISTCEVFGQLPLKSKSKFSEKSPYNPRTPYNAGKASGDLIAKAYYHTFNLPLTISYCCNNYGTHQFPEKVIPVFVLRAMMNEPLPVFKSSGNKREWIHVSDHCRAVDLILEKGKISETYNIIGTGLEKTITNIADDVLGILKKPKTLKQIVPDRPGHDSRYLLDFSKIKKLGWKPQVKWSDGLKETVEWYKNNENWWKPLLAKSNAWK